MIPTLLSVLGLVIVALLLALLKISDLSKDMLDDAHADHAKCIAHIASTVSNEFLAARLRDYAKQADSVEEIPKFARLRNTHSPAGPSVLAMWLNEKAEALTNER